MLKRQKGSPSLNVAVGDGIRRIRKNRLAERFYGAFNMDSGVCPFCVGTVCAGSSGRMGTMAELVEKPAGQYGWSASVPNFSGKMRRSVN